MQMSLNAHAEYGTLVCQRDNQFPLQELFLELLLKLATTISHKLIFEINQG